MNILKTVLQKLDKNKKQLDKVELSLSSDLNRLVNALNSDISIHNEVRSQSNKIFSTLVSIMPQANERVKTNRRVVKATDGKINLANRAIDKAQQAAKDLDIKPNSINNYNKVLNLIEQVKKSQQDVEDLTKRIEGLIR